MVADLLDWDSMYPAGRLQKPVKILEKPTKQEDPDLRLALSLNLAASLHTALLLLPDRFSEERLYSTIAGLSYAGDFRMFVGGEDRNKVSNIVQANMSQFRALYSKNLQYMSQFVSIGQDWSEIEQDVSPAGRHHHLALLPKNVQGKLVSVWNEDGRYRDVEDVLRAAAFERESGDIVNTVLERIVWAPSITQAIKGIITAGISKSAIYALSKLKKGVISYGRPRSKTSA
jgi:translocator assembly and maintenance protein 41